MTRTRFRPTLRGACVLVLAAGLWVIADRTGLRAPVGLAAALLVAVVLGALAALAGGIGLGLRRTVLHPEVTAPGAVRTELELARGALLRRVPLGRASVRCDLPMELGGPRELGLEGRAPLDIGVARRGFHELGPCRIRVRDLFGFFQLTRTVDAGGTVIGLPRAEDLTPGALGRAGLAREGDADETPHAGIGEAGPLARAYAAGDDVRRIHWRASARTGRLMTREDEPVEARGAVIVLDGRGAEADAALGDRLIDAVATVRRALVRAGWSVRVVDPSGESLMPDGTGGVALGSAGSVGRESERAALLALADLDLAESASSGADGRAPLGLGPGTALAVLIAADGPARADGRAAPDGSDTPDGGAALAAAEPLTAGVPTRTALLLRAPGPRRIEPRTDRTDGWTIVRASAEEPLASTLAALAAEAVTR